ncbi:MAG: MFS transporter, partial [Bacteroidota bacterium]
RGAGIGTPCLGGCSYRGRYGAIAGGLSGDAAELATGQAALGNIAIFPGILIFVFAGLYLYMRSRKPAEEAQPSLG